MNVKSDDKEYHPINKIKNEIKSSHIMDAIDYP
jgi:hypothetical protein